MNVKEWEEVTGFSELATDESGTKTIQFPGLHSETAGRNGYMLAKRVFDFICSFALTIALLPLFAVISAAIRLTSRGPVIYRQKRIGKNGTVFMIYKFRSMVDGAEKLEDHLSPELVEYYRVNRKIENDPRITRIGSILRRTSLDELPQLFNIIKGEMSIVGPRPMMPDEIEMYGDNFRRYIAVTPGLTGLWQIKCRHITTMLERAELDKEYIENRSFTYDLYIMFKTFGTVLSKKGAC